MRVWRCTREEFSVLRTVWRLGQSAANPSPPRIPGNRENYREFSEFSNTICTLVRAKSQCSSAIVHSPHFSPLESNRELTGGEQGKNKTLHGISPESRAGCGEWI